MCFLWASMQSRAMVWRFGLNGANRGCNAQPEEGMKEAAPARRAAHRESIVGFGILKGAVRNILFLQYSRHN